MKINREYASPNYGEQEIPVEFIVLHYTAGDLTNTLDLFLDETKEVSSHLIVAEDGEIFEIVKCWDDVVNKAWHAGRSKWSESGRGWEEFNNFSIGIEIENRNGNIFPYTCEQYEALGCVTEHFRSKYKALNVPERIIGHEQIAGWRGKVDPGYYFDWERYYSENYVNRSYPKREQKCHLEILKSFEKFGSDRYDLSSQNWHAISHAMETANRLLQK